MVWFNLVFSSFATPEKPLPHLRVFLRLLSTRASGFYTHITLHHIIEHVDFAAAGVQIAREAISYRERDGHHGALLKAHSVSVLAARLSPHSGYEVLGPNVLLGTHGTFASTPNSAGFQQTRQS